MRKYALGLDFGTLSGRAVLINIETGDECATAVREYAHGVMSDTFVNGKPLPNDYALQHPADYLEVLSSIIQTVLAESGANPEDIVGIGIDFTAATILPVTQDGTPLCFLEGYKENPHAYVKLWKHHAAQKEADDINRLAKETGAPWLSRYGSIISSEWLFPKVLQILREDEALYNETYRFTEAGDWLVWQMTGKETHSVCTTGFKGMWNEKTGYPDTAFLKALDPRLEHIIGDKLSEHVIKLSETAGYVTEEFAAKTGLKAGTPVAPAYIDAHAALPALGITKPGELLLIIGTSSCHLLLSEQDCAIAGISGSVKDGVVDGLYAIEAGQVCVGDSFDWFVHNCVPKSYEEDAEKCGMNIHKYLRSKAEQLPPGSDGLLALDWWNGNRTPYVNGNLSGLLVGLTINTKPEQIYRALIESTAYGTKRIIDLYEESGIKIHTIYAAGGIAEKDPLLMQIYADVTGKDIKVSGTPQACAYGSAVRGAVNPGGYSTLTEAAQSLGKVKDVIYRPHPDATEAYSKLYEEYKKLSVYFAEGANPVMEALKTI